MKSAQCLVFGFCNIGDLTINDLSQSYILDYKQCLFFQDFEVIVGHRYLSNLFMCKYNSK